jgi:hypothetical protein
MLLSKLRASERIFCAFIVLAFTFDALSVLIQSIESQALLIGILLIDGHPAVNRKTIN